VRHALFDFAAHLFTPIRIAHLDEEPCSGRRVLDARLDVAQRPQSQSVIAWTTMLAEVAGASMTVRPVRSSLIANTPSKLLDVRSHRDEVDDGTTFHVA
jgi:hypothetical protein